LRLIAELRPHLNQTSDRRHGNMPSVDRACATGCQLRRCPSSVSRRDVSIGLKRKGRAISWLVGYVRRALEINHVQRPVRPPRYLVSWSAGVCQRRCACRWSWARDSVGNGSSQEECSVGLQLQP
jgi:hypothetical protein